MTVNPPEPIAQIGYLVTDLEDAVQSWFEQTGIGPWHIYRGVEMPGTLRGQDVTVVIDVALSYSGETQVELIEVVSDAPSPYHHADGSRQLGLHHIARITDDLEHELAAAPDRGLTVLFTGTSATTEVAYFESTALPGTVIEYICSPHARAMLAAGVDEARNWDGTDLIR